MDKDPVLSKVKAWVQTGWPDGMISVQQELQPFVRRKNELSVEAGCILWGNRVVIPTIGREQVVTLIHEAHPGISRMKNLARSYFWWPGIDKQLENCVKSRETCQMHQRSSPPSCFHPWSWPNKPWSRVHIDYAGPFLGKMFLVMIDAHTKWMEVHMTTSSTSSTTISLLRKTFAALGLPDVIVSDNGSNFCSDEFADFLKKNGVKNIRTAPYHPASNGLAERAVQTFKEGMKKLTEGTLETKLARFLFKYRMTPQTATGVSPAELLYGRPLQSHLDAARPDLQKKVLAAQDRQKSDHDKRAKLREFQVGDAVYAQNYGPGEKWLPGNVSAVIGTTMYEVLLADRRTIRRHADQLRSRLSNEQRQTDSTKPTQNDSDELELTVPVSVPDDEENAIPSVPEDNHTDQEAETVEADNQSISDPQIRRSSHPSHPPDRYGYSS